MNAVIDFAEVDAALEKFLGAKKGAIDADVIAVSLVPLIKRLCAALASERSARAQAEHERDAAIARIGELVVEDIRK